MPINLKKSPDRLFNGLKGSSILAVTGYQTGVWSDGSNDGSWTNRVYSIMQLINGDSSNVQQWAMGDGSIIGEIESTCTGCTPWTSEVDESWNGDTTELITPASSGEYYARTQSGTVPTTDPEEEATAIAFTGEEVWDCSGDAEATIAVDMAALTIACGEYSIVPDGGNSWINCYEAIGD